MTLLNRKQQKQNKEKILIKKRSSFFFGLFVNFLKPSVYLDSIKEIDLNALKEQGIKLIICDLDNTLVPHYTKFPTQTAINFVNDVKKAGFDFSIVSNNTSKRVSFFAEKLGISDFISGALIAESAKPRSPTPCTESTSLTSAP